MRPFRKEPTKIAEWQALVVEARSLLGYRFDESIEHYLVITLDHFTNKNGISSVLLAQDYLTSINLESRIGVQQLRTVGDECLLLSGLFPERALHKNVTLNYFITLGKNAYHTVAIKPIPELSCDLFLQLSHDFVGLMDVLNAMRFVDR